MRNAIKNDRKLTMWNKKTSEQKKKTTTSPNTHTHTHKTKLRNKHKHTTDINFDNQLFSNHYYRILGKVYS